MTLVRVYADAAFRHADGASAAGGHIIRDAEAANVCELLNDPCGCQHSAELCAIAFVVRHAIEIGFVTAGDEVAVISDSQVALMHLARKHPRKKIRLSHAAGSVEFDGKLKKCVEVRMVPKYPEYARLALGIRLMIKEAGARLTQARWVKGHNLEAGTEDAALNHLCDSLAKTALKRSRKVAA